MNNAQIQQNPAFNPSHFDAKNIQVINALKTGLQQNIEKCIKEIDSLKSSVSLYKESANDFVDLAVERSDTIAKYSKANNAGSYNLPGVFASSMGGYDLDAMRQDNQRMIQLNDLYETAESQRDTYFKMIVRAQNEMKIYLNAIARINNDMNIFLEQLSQETSWESNKNVKKI
jgi:Cu/Ag efflux pump CusA